MAFYSFNVDTQPNIKIVEYPLIIGDWRRRRDNRGNLGTFAVPTVRTRPDLVIGGVSYPIIKIIPYPPLTPEVSIFSYQNTDNKVLINLSPSVGEYIGEKSFPYISFDAEEKEVVSDTNIKPTTIASSKKKVKSKK